MAKRFDILPLKLNHHHAVQELVPGMQGVRGAGAYRQHLLHNGGPVSLAFAAPFNNTMIPAYSAKAHRNKDHYKQLYTAHRCMYVTCALESALQAGAAMMAVTPAACAACALAQVGLLSRGPSHSGLSWSEIRIILRRVSDFPIVLITGQRPCLMPPEAVSRNQHTRPPQ